MDTLKGLVGTILIASMMVVASCGSTGAAPSVPQATAATPVADTNQQKAAPPRPAPASRKTASQTVIKRFNFGGMSQGAAQWGQLADGDEVALIGDTDSKNFKVSVLFEAKPQQTFNGHEIMKVYFKAGNTDVGEVIVFHWPADACNRSVMTTVDATALIPLRDIDGVKRRRDLYEQHLSLCTMSFPVQVIRSGDGGNHVFGVIRRRKLHTDP